MYILNLDSNDVYQNLATDEYFLSHKPTNIFFLWQNTNCIVVGQNQNTNKEINRDFVEENHIKIVRRMSGGGAVYQDLGNLNFSFIQKNNEDDFLNFKKFLIPIIQVLKQLGVDAYLSGRNDLLIDEKKFSGNSQFVNKEWLLHHGTIMFDVNLEMAQKSLNVNKNKLQAKGIDSVRSRITNVKDYLKTDLDIKTFKQMIFDQIKKDYPNTQEYVLTEEDKEKIKKIRDTKYATWEHNFGKNLEFDHSFSQYIPNVGSIEIYLSLKNDIIKSVKIYGDFFSKRDLLEVENVLTNVKYQKESIIECLNSLKNFNDYFNNLSIKEFVSIIFN